MKTILTFSILLVTYWSVWAQQPDNQTQKLSKVVENSQLIIYKDSKWDNKFEPYSDKSNYRVVSIDIDTSKLYPVVRKAINPVHYKQLNSKSWYIFTVSNNQGQIQTISFWFKNEAGVDINEFTLLAEQIKREITWKLTFNRSPVVGLFYISCSVRGPKF